MANAVLEMIAGLCDFYSAPQTGWSSVHLGCSALKHNTFPVIRCHRHFLFLKSKQVNSAADPSEESVCAGHTRTSMNT